MSSHLTTTHRNDIQHTSKGFKMSTPVHSRIHRLCRILALGTAAMALGACGGGGSSDDFDIRFHSFSISPSTLTIPATGTQNFTISWRTAASGATSAAYTLSAYALRTDSSDQVSTSTKFWQNGCSPTRPCSSTSTRTDNCTIDSAGRVACEFPIGTTQRELARGSYRVVARACGFDSQIREVCVDRSTETLTVN